MKLSESKATKINWDRRFLQQARWTQNLRHYLYNRIGLDPLNHIIEVGCGTGAILADFNAEDKKICGLDISRDFLRLAQKRNAKFKLILGDAHSLPFKENAFDVVLCHYFLLWVSEPILVLKEMRRIAGKNSPILVLAEPDYGGRIDYPDEIKILGKAQTESLIRQGADPFIGRRLGRLFHDAGISLIEMGIMGGQWFPHISDNFHDDEWEILNNDIKTSLQYSGNPTLKQSDVEKLKKIHQYSLQTGERVLFVPTFYAWGKANK